MRGVFTFTAGEEEEKIAMGYREKAAKAEEEGFHRLATALRQLASSYEGMAEHEKQPETRMMSNLKRDRKSARHL